MGRILADVLAAFMAFMGIQKFIGDVPIFQIIEANLQESFRLTLPFIDPVGKWVTGVLELGAAGLLVLLATRFYGAALSVAVIGGVILAHLTVLGIHTPTTGEPGAAESPVLFIMAVGSFLLALATTYLNRPSNA